MEGSRARTETTTRLNLKEKDSVWSCNKCSAGFEPISGSRVCGACRNTKCVDCGGSLGVVRCDTQRCHACKKAHALRRSLDWYRDQKDRKRAYDAQRRAEKPDLYRAASRRHRLNHPETKNADTAARRAARMQRTPAWADKKRLRAIYASCPPGFHVDHIVPLRGKHGLWPACYGEPAIFAGRRESAQEQPFIPRHR